MRRLASLSADPWAGIDDIRQKLARNRLKTPLFDTKALTRHLEAAYSKMYERYLANLPPEDLYVPFLR